MKRSKFSILGLLIINSLLLFNYTHGQKIEFRMGPEYKLAKRSQIPAGFVYGDSKSSFMLRMNYGSMWSRKAQPSVEKYDGKMNMVYSKSLNTAVNGLLIHDLMWCKDKFLLVTSRFDKASLTNTAYGNFVDVDGNVEPKAIDLMKLQAEVKRYTGNFRFRISDDSSKVLVYANPPYEKDANQKFAFEVYNTALEKQWEKVVTLPYKDKMVGMYDEVVSNNGDVYLLIKKYDGEVLKEAKKGESGKEANYKFMILAYTNQGNDYKEYTIDLSGKFVVDPTFKLDPKGNLAFAGFYKEKLGGSEKGIFYMTIDAESKAVKASSTKEFTTEMIEAMGKNADERKKNGKDAGLRNFVFRKFILKDDGGAVLLAENYYVETRVYVDRNGTRVVYYYHFNDILAIGVDPKGNVDWFTRIPKKQVSQNAPSPAFGFTPLVCGDKIYIVYNDNKKNLEGDTKGKAKGFGGAGGIALVAIIDSKGGVTKKELFDAKKDKTVMCARLARQVTPNSLAVYMQKGKKYRIGSLTVN